MKKNNVYLCIFFAFGCASPAQAQMITTIAGTAAASGLVVDGGPATGAQLYSPEGMKKDAAGNLYFADEESHRIRKIDAAGMITTIAGSGATAITSAGYSGDGGPATAAKLYEPADVAFDHAGNMYIADYSNQCIRKVDTAGTITTFAGTGYSTSGYSGDGGLATAATLNHPGGVAADSTGNVYISDGYNHRIRKVDTAGIITTFAGTGTAGYGGDGSPATAALMGFPGGIITDGTGNVYFAEATNNVIRKVDASGIITTIAGTGAIGSGADGIPATASVLCSPHYLVFDGLGNMYFSDLGNNRVRKIDVSGIITTIAGNGIRGYYGDDSCAATYAQFSDPFGVAVDGAGSVYIGDRGNNRIRKTIPDHAPAFTGGHSHSIIACGGISRAIDSLLSITDIDNGQTETWSVLSPASHGMVVAAYSAATSGAALTPAGLSYTSVSGYTGNDTFKIVVNDCANGSDTTTFYVTVADCALKAPPGLPQGEEVLRLLPNPNEGSFIFILSSTVDESVRIVITNMVGEQVKELTTTTNKQTDIQLDAPAGVYFLSAATAQGRWSEKIVVVR